MSFERENAEVAVLDWQGPLDLSDFDMPEDPAAYQVPAIYLCVATYDTRIWIYVGMSRNFLDRFRSHITATLGLTYGLRNDRGEYDYEIKPPPAFFENLADPERLAELQRMAAAEVRRQRWFFAEVEPGGLPYAEGLLIRHVRSLAEVGATLDGKPVLSDNGNAGRAPMGPLVLENRGADLPCDLLGGEVVWPMEAAA